MKEGDEDMVDGLTNFILGIDTLSSDKDFSQTSDNNGFAKDIIVNLVVAKCAYGTRRQANVCDSGLLWLQLLL